MVKVFEAACLALACLPQVLAHSQIPLGQSEVGASGKKKLHGKFLHITDIHPDFHYRSGSSIDRDCHHGSGEAGYYGTAGSDCDSPLTLVNATFAWIDENLKDSIDFVVWTGDSARHDNDEKIPRTRDEVLSLNQMLIDQLLELFGKKQLQVPIIPTLGNNDIMPHNILRHGPNRWTKAYLQMWDRFIPEEQRHTFAENGWFLVEAIPNKLAVISLNTMYFFDSNNAVDGCYDTSEPGYEHFEWLRIQLQFLRERGMKAILIGHVGPAKAGKKQNWDDTCWQKYTLWLRQYRDIIVGSVYGHMNIDHFMFQDFHKLKIPGLDIEGAEDGSPEGTGFKTQGAVDYLASLREDWAGMPSPPTLNSGVGDDVAADGGVDIDKKKKFFKKIGGPFAERYSVALVSPSVIPNYYPTLRVVEYNITGLEDVATWVDSWQNSENFSSKDDDEEEEETDESNEEPEDADADAMKKKKKHKKNKKKKPKFKVPDEPSASTPPGPAYSNQALTWLGYTQYYADLDRLNEKSEGTKARTWREYLLSKAEGDPQPPSKFKFEVEYDTQTDKVYKLKDLTVRNFFDLAHRMAKGHPRASSALDRGDDDEEIEHSGSQRDPATYNEEREQEEESVPDLCESKKKTKKHKKKKNKVWLTFLHRAFVGYRDYDDSQVDAVDEVGMDEPDDSIC